MWTSEIIRVRDSQEWSGTRSRLSSRRNSRSDRESVSKRHSSPRSDPFDALEVAHQVHAEIRHREGAPSLAALGPTGRLGERKPPSIADLQTRKSMTRRARLRPAYHQVPLTILLADRHRQDPRSNQTSKNDQAACVQCRLRGTGTVKGARRRQGPGIRRGSPSQAERFCSWHGDGAARLGQSPTTGGYYIIDPAVIGAWPRKPSSLQAPRSSSAPLRTGPRRHRGVHAPDMAARARRTCTSDTCSMSPRQSESPDAQTESAPAPRVMAGGYGCICVLIAQQAGAVLPSPSDGPHRRRIGQLAKPPSRVMFRASSDNPVGIASFFNGLLGGM